MPKFHTIFFTVYIRNINDFHIIEIGLKKLHREKICALADKVNEYSNGKQQDFETEGKRKKT